jgi:hypothetical protein
LARVKLQNFKILRNWLQRRELRRGSKLQRRRKMRRRAEKRNEIELQGGKHPRTALLGVFYHFLTKNHCGIFVN